MSARRLSFLLLLVGFVLASCGDDTLVAGVENGTYTARVPSAEQLASPGADALPTAFTGLREEGVDHIEITVTQDEVEISVDGEPVTSRTVADRSRLLAQESASAFQSRIEAEILQLAGGELEIPGLEIDRPSVAPARANDPSVITLRPYQGTPPIDLGCVGDDECLLAVSASAPTGEYRAVPRGATESPVASIEVVDGVLELALPSGETVAAARPGEPERATTVACGISETEVWEVPDVAGIDMRDPVVVHSSCLGESAGSYLTMLERSDIPVLAPWGNPMWCDLGPVDASEEGVPPECFVFTRQE